MVKSKKPPLQALLNVQTTDIIHQTTNDQSDEAGGAIRAIHFVRVRSPSIVFVGTGFPTCPKCLKQLSLGKKIKRILQYL